MRKKWIFPALIGSGTGLALACVLLLMMAGVSLRADDPAPLIPVLALTALYAGAAAGGWTSGRIAKENGLLCGALAGAVYALVCGIGSLILKSTKSGGAVIGICLSLIAVSAVLGRLALPRALSPKQRYRKQALTAKEKTADKKAFPVVAADSRRTPVQTRTGRKAGSRQNGADAGQPPRGYLT